ncbi:PAS domain-containing protein [Dongia rigui]|uniref:PAS domain-containing protein n=1 Tax=Dongia rigui TaxID=940149 RepID=A0ABU5E3I5_9PROT|nr:PAS domain-containing protein [Dongia rigui]MDY0874184.1 PAS domain-containing protein [Dongia rigui]
MGVDSAMTGIPDSCIDTLQDQRLIRLLAYWQQKCLGRLMPSPADIEPLEFKFILGYVTLVDIETAPRRYFFRLDGSILASLSGMDYTGKYLDQLGLPEYCDFVAATYDRVIDGRRPYAYRKRGAFDKASFSEETIILPLGKGEQVQRLMVAVIPGGRPGNDGKMLI